MKLKTDEALRDHLRRSVLAKGETLVWVGRPSRLSYAACIPGNPKFVFLVMASFTTVIVLISLLGISIVFFGDTGILEMILSTLFIGLFLGGYYVMIGYKIETAGQTYYAVTERRIVILQFGWFGSSQTLRANDVTDLKLHEWGDGGGTIIFRKTAPFDTGEDVPQPHAMDAFWGVKDVLGAYDAVQELLKKA